MADVVAPERALSRPSSVCSRPILDSNGALYNVEKEDVVVLIVGRKVGNRLIVEGEEFHGHQDHPVEPPGNESQEDAE